MDIGRRIRETREDLGMPRNELARRVGVAGNHLYMIESGSRMPSLGLVERVAHALRVTPADLVREEPENVLTGPPKADVPAPGRLVDLPQVKEWLARQDATFATMSEEEFVEVVAEIESLEELEELYDRITQEHGRIEEELGKTGLGKELFPSRGVRDLTTKREREGEAMRPYRNVWQLRQEIGRLYGALERAIENYSMYLFNEGKTEDFLIHPRRIATMPESTRRALADVRRETFREVLAGVGV
jgi:transcriptional regulator with XRE-family HTH domain